MLITAQNRNEELGRFFNALTDRPLEPDDAAYVPRVHDEDNDDPIADLARQILWNEGGGTYLLPASVAPAKAQSYAACGGISGIKIVKCSCSTWGPICMKQSRWKLAIF